MSVSQWNHVQGKNNPTDSGSRVKSLHHLLQSTPKGVMRFTGPELLSKNCNVIGETDLEALQDNNKDIKTNDFLVATLRKNSLSRKDLN